jgi:hypothetical protein
VDLSERHPLFVGFKLDGSLRRQLEALSGPDRKYVSGQDATFLSLCRRGEDVYVGKVIEDGLTTGRVDDVRRNVLSIMRRLCPETRLPDELQILVCLPADSTQPPETEKPSFEGF